MNKEAILVFLDKPLEEVPDAKLTQRELQFLSLFLDGWEAEYIPEVRDLEKANNTSLAAIKEKIDQMLNESMVPDRLIAYDERH